MGDSIDADQSTQLSSFLKTFGGRNVSQQVIPSPAAIQPKTYADTEISTANQQILSQIDSQIQAKSQQIDRLQSEIRTLLRIQNDQAIALEMALQDRRDLERQLSGLSAGLTFSSDGKSAPNRQVNTSSPIQSKDTPYFLENSMFLRSFIRNDIEALTELTQSITAITDLHTRGLAGQSLFSQISRFFSLNSLYEKLIVESQSDTFVTTFEQATRSLLESKRVILWARIPSAKVIISRTLSMMIPETEGILSNCLTQNRRQIITDPTRDPSYSLTYDSPTLSTARVTLLQPVYSNKQLIWVIQLIDRLSPKGSIITPSGDDFLLLDFLSSSLLNLFHESSHLEDMMKRILTESTRSLITERQVTPLLETVQLTVTHLVACESLEIFFYDSANKTLFKFDSVSQLSKKFYQIERSGIAGAALMSKKTINAPIASHHPSYSEDVDGAYPNGPVLAVPLLSNNKTVSLVAVARQKRNSIVFTSSDEIILETLSRVSQGALLNAQSHERNLDAIQKALTNHKYYTALLAVAEDLSGVLERDELIHKVMTRAQNFIGADRCSLFLLDREHRKLWSVVNRGEERSIEIEMGAGIVGHVIKTGETVNIPDAYLDERFDKSVDQATGYKTKSVLCVPIECRGEVIGCTQMINKENGFSDTDSELMRAFNVFCGIALNNADMYKLAKEGKEKASATLDLITNLNSKEFDTFIKCEKFIINKVSPPKEDALAYVYETRETLISNKHTLLKKMFKTVCGIETSSVRNLVLVPIFDLNARVFGVASCVNLEDFSEENVQIVKSVALFMGLSTEKWQDEIDLSERLSPSELTSVTLPESVRVTREIYSIDFDFSKLDKSEVSKAGLCLFHTVKALFKTVGSILSIGFDAVSVADVQFAILALGKEFPQFDQISLLALLISLAMRSEAIKQVEGKTNKGLEVLYGKQCLTEKRASSKALRKLSKSGFFNGMTKADIDTFQSVFSDVMVATGREMQDQVLKEGNPLQVLARCSVMRKALRTFEKEKPWWSCICDEVGWSDDIEMKMADYLEIIALPAFSTLDKVLEGTSWMKERVEDNLKKWRGMFFAE